MADKGKVGMQMPDWEHYDRNKAEIEEETKKLLESGQLQAMGHPPGITLEYTARALCTIFHKDPEANQKDGNGKLLTSSQKRAMKRYDRQREDGPPVEVELTEDQFKIIPNEEYVKPPTAPYIKDGKQMPKDFVPIKHLEGQQATPVLEAPEGNKKGDQQV